MNGGHGLMGGTLLGAIQTDDFFRFCLLEIDHLGNSCFLKFSMINLNLKYNNDDLKKSKNNWK